MAACGRQGGNEPSTSFILDSFSLQAVKKETIWRGQVFSIHSLSPELSRTLIRHPKRIRLTQTLPTHVSIGSCQSVLGAVTKNRIAASWFTIRHGTGVRLWSWLLWGNPYFQGAYSLVGQLDNKVRNK